MDVDLLVVGGGINGAGIARDAAGRGLSVLLVEQHDLGAATSSASSKLIHGGLRYLERYEFRLVREALAEREVLLRAAPHLVHPMRFVMPHVAGLRPGWVIRAGLFLYDHLARRQTLPASHGINLRHAPWNAGLRNSYTCGFAYSDCWVDDARLVIANARAALELGATVCPRTRCVAVRRRGRLWHATLLGQTGAQHDVTARALVNATGPWARTFLSEVVNQPVPFELKLIKGSHIVVPRLYCGDHAFILQNNDGRVVFVYPYEERFTLVGTTDIEHQGAPGECEASFEEVEYLCRAANRYFAREISPADVVWRYCGIRPLFDDGEPNPSRITRDYVLRIDGTDDQSPLLSIFGGKITTYRRLAERAVNSLAPWLSAALPWTERALLPGGEGLEQGCDALAESLAHRYPALPATCLASLVRRHGSRSDQILGNTRTVADLGIHFGSNLYALELDYFMEQEWALTSEDVLWRRTKYGLHLNAKQKQQVEAYMKQYLH